MTLSFSMHLREIAPPGSANTGTGMPRSRVQASIFHALESRRIARLPLISDRGCNDAGCVRDRSARQCVFASSLTASPEQPVGAAPRAILLRCGLEVESDPVGQTPRRCPCIRRAANSNVPWRGPTRRGMRYGFFGKSNPTVSSVALCASCQVLALNVNSATAHVGMWVISDER